MSATALALPSIIQGGMGIGVSGWTLARAVSRLGQLGVVSGTAVDSLLVRRLQDGDPGGHMRRAMASFPIPGACEAALSRWFEPDGRPDDTPYRLLPMWRHGSSVARGLIAMLASYVEVFLAREGHDGVVGINLLTKVQLPNLATLYGAMLAGVDYVIMGAGIPREIPAALDAFAEGRAATLKLDLVSSTRGTDELITLDPAAYWDGRPPVLKRPLFLPVISSHSLATVLVRKAAGRIDGFVVEGPTAGGHNAPPRGSATQNERGEPVYGERDAADLAVMRDLGLPFWLAGGMASPAKLDAALSEGAAGIQVGTLFAFAEESGVDPALRRQVIDRATRGAVDVLTDPQASPTGFPFKVIGLPGTASEPEVYAARTRKCDLGYLRTPFRREDGRIDYRCAAEPVDTFVAKGGLADETAGRKCLCNALMANIGHGQVRPDADEPALLTSGDDLRHLGDFLHGRKSYAVRDVLEYLQPAVFGLDPRSPRHDISARAAPLASRATRA